MKSSILVAIAMTSLSGRTLFMMTQVYNFLAKVMLYDYKRIVESGMGEIELVRLTMSGAFLVT